MYCAACGTPLTPGLSYCNRCGMHLKERDSSKQPVTAYLTAITLVGVLGLCLMLFGAIALKDGAGFNEDIIGIFMLMSFVIIGVVEFSLCRQLSRVNRAAEKRDALPPMMHAGIPNELRAAQPRSLNEPIPSVTENTTRTLQYSRNDPSS
jgi:hypothetical protein